MPGHSSSEPGKPSRETPTHLLAVVEPRYWEDATINGIQDDEGNLVPGRSGDGWRILIDLATGKVENWPAGIQARIHYKVCDAGEYWLASAEGRPILKWTGIYVPGAFLCHGKEGWGDYICLEIGGDGMIAAYEPPKVRDEDWVAVARPVPDATDLRDAVLRDVAAERRRQIEGEGWAAAHDDAWRNGELAAAGSCYAVADFRMEDAPPPEWPWDASWWKPSGHRRNLVKAAALLLAEIERLDRADAG